MFPLFLITIAFSILTQLLSSTQKVKRGSLKDFTFPQIADGDPLNFVAGTVKVEGTGLVWYGDFFTKKIKKDSGIMEFGLVGSLLPSQTIGYKYFLGWQLVICLGPNVRLKKVWFGTKSGDDETEAEEDDPNFTDPNDPKVPTPIWQGDMGTGHIKCTDLDAFGGDQGGGGYDLDIYFYGGESSQTTNAYLQSKIAGFVPPYRGVSYAVVHGYIGNSTQLQNMTFEVERIYDPLGLGSVARVGSEGDANSANLIWELMTNNFGAASAPVSRLDEPSFLAAGHTLHDEDDGISLSVGGSPVQIKETVQDILKQIDGTLYDDPEVGKIFLKLNRPDYDIDDIPEIDESSIISVTNYTTNLWSDTKNRIRVKFEDRKKDYDDRTAIADDMANVAFQGGQVKGVNIDYPNIKRRDHANRVAVRDLNLYSTPITKMSVSTQRFSTKIRPGSVLKATYSPYKIGRIVFRVLKVSYGDLINNRLVLELAIDKFAKTTAIYSSPVNYFARPYTGAVSIRDYILEESPRWFNLGQPNVRNPDASRVLLLPYKRNQAQQAYNLWGRVSGEPNFAILTDTADYSDYGVAYANIAQEYDSTDIELASITDSDILTDITGDQIQDGGLNLLQIDNEIIAFETYSLNVSSRYVLSGVQRGLLDTTPAAHAVGARIAFMAVNHVGAREFPSTAAVQARIGSVAPTGQQNVDEAAPASLTLASRPVRPYPPADVEFDGVAFPETLTNLTPIDITWARRDRLNTRILFQTDADETPEATTEYFINAGPAGLLTETSLGTGTAATYTFYWEGLNVVQIYAKRDGFLSNILEFQTVTLHGTGVSAGGDLDDVSVSAPGGKITIDVDGGLDTVDVSMVLSSHFEGDIGTITVLAPAGHAVVSVNASGSIGDPIGVIPIEGEFKDGVFGDIGTITVWGPSGSLSVHAHGDVGSIVVSPIDGVVTISIGYGDSYGDNYGGGS